MRNYISYEYRKKDVFKFDRIHISTFSNGGGILLMSYRMNTISQHGFNLEFYYIIRYVFTLKELTVQRRLRGRADVQRAPGD